MRPGAFPVLLAALLAAVSTHAGEEEITAAYYSGEIEQLRTLRADLDPATYLSAYLDWRLGSLLFDGDTIDQADATLLRAQETLERLTAAQPGSAEAWALLSVTIGMRIGVNPGARGMKMGPASGKAGKRALKLEPDNPRVLLVIGINKFNTPFLFGGGKKRAMKYLDKSLAGWRKNPAGAYRWGEADSHLWRGRTHEKLGDTESACTDYAAALQVSPGYEWGSRLHSQLGCSES